MKISMKTPMWVSKAYKVWTNEKISNCAAVFKKGWDVPLDRVLS